eukprot:SAG22_NODE_19917_length_270_cov_0.900585_2_plen_41_part_01
MGVNPRASEVDLAVRKPPAINSNSPSNLESLHAATSESLHT